MEVQGVDGKRKADAHAIGDAPTDRGVGPTEGETAADAPRSSNEPRDALSANDAKPPRKKFADWARTHPKGFTIAYANVWLLFTLIPIVHGLLAENGVKKYLFLTLVVTFDIVYFRVWLVYPSIPTSERGFSPGLLGTIAALIALETMAAFFADGGNVQLLIFVSSVIAYTTSGRARALSLAGLLAFAALQTTLLVRLGKTSLQEGVTSFALLCVLTITFYAVGGTIAFHKELEIKNKKIEQLTQEAERERIGSDLHDILGHSLTGITMVSELAARLLEAGRVEEAREQLRAVTAQSNEALADVRRIVAATRALSPIEELEEARALLEVARVDADITNEGEPPSGPRSAAAAHVIREGVTNAIMHAHPSWVRIRLSPGGVTVTNDGYSAAYAASSAGSGSGLAGLSELVGDEGTLTWGASGSTWTLALAFEATPDAYSS